MPRFLVTVKPGSSQEKVVETSSPTSTTDATPPVDAVPTIDTTPPANAAPATDTPAAELTVYLRAKPHDGEANAALIKLLSKHFKVGKTSIKILRGAKSRQKLIEF